MTIGFCTMCEGERTSRTNHVLLRRCVSAAYICRTCPGNHVVGATHTSAHVFIMAPYCSTPVYSALRSPWQCSASSLFVATEGAIVVYNLFVSSQARRETPVIRRGANASREQEQKLDDGRERTSWREFIYFRGLTNSVRDVLECFVLVSYSVFSNIIPSSLYIPNINARKVHHELLPSRKTLDDTIIRVEDACQDKLYALVGLKLYGSLR